jgi:type I restriction enzyme S subunit
MSQNKNWQIKKLDDVCRKLSLNKLKIKQKQYLPKGLFPVIDQGQDLIGGYYNDESLLVSDEPPYIVFGDHTKIKKFIPFRFVPGADGVKVLKPKENILAKFLYYLLFTIKIEDKGYARHFQLLEKETFLIPHDLETQNLIVSKIEELFSELDKGIEDLKTAQQQLKTYRQSVLKYAFEGKLTNKKVKDGELPKGWISFELKDLVDKISDGPFGSNLKSIDYVKEGVRVIRLENIGVLEFRNENKSFVTEEKYETIKRHTVTKGDIIFSSFIIDNIRTVILPDYIDKAINKADCFLVRCTDSKINRKYLCYYFSTKAMKYQLEESIHGATRPRINTTQLKSTKIPVCSIEQQQLIVQEIESRLSVADKMEESIGQCLLQAETLRQSILKKAFSGDLV